MWGSAAGPRCGESRVKNLQGQEQEKYKTVQVTDNGGVGGDRSDGSCVLSWMEIEGNPRGWGAASEEICGAGEMGRTRLCVNLEWDGLGEVFTDELF